MSHVSIWHEWYFMVLVTAQLSIKGKTLDFRNFLGQCLLLDIIIQVLQSMRNHHQLLVLMCSVCFSMRYRSSSRSVDPLDDWLENHHLYRKIVARDNSSLFRAVAEQVSLKFWILNIYQHWCIRKEILRVNWMNSSV